MIFIPFSADCDVVGNGIATGNYDFGGMLFDDSITNMDASGAERNQRARPKGLALLAAWRDRASR